jgi:hypothetical protein
MDATIMHDDEGIFEIKNSEGRKLEAYIKYEKIYSVEKGGFICRP